MEQQEQIWALVELFGHQKMAGLCSEESRFGTSMLRIDVPSTTSNPPFTRYLNPTAVYAINPITEEMGKAMAEQLQKKPIDVWDVREFISKTKALQAASATEEPHTNRDHDEDDKYDELEG